MGYKFKVSAERSDLMRKIRSNKTAPEIILQKALRKENIKFRKNYVSITGKPDIAFIDKRIAVFIDGEFWHGYHWELKKEKIKNNRDYWIPKIERTIARDKKNNRELRKSGWQVIRFWQHQVIKDLAECIRIIKKTLR